MQHATERVERPGESQEALDGKKMLFSFTEPVTEPFVLLNGPVAECVGLLGRQKKGLNVLASHNGRSMEKKKKQKLGNAQNELASLGPNKGVKSCSTVKSSNRIAQVLGRPF